MNSTKKLIALLALAFSIKDGIRHGNGFGDGIKNAWQIEFLRARLGDFAPQVKHARNWKTGPAIRWQVCVSDDVARADDDNGTKV